MRDINSVSGKKYGRVTLTANFALYVVIFLGALIFTQALRSRASNILFSFVFFLPLGSLIYALTSRAALKVQMLTESVEIAKKQPYEYKIRLINEWIFAYPFVDAMLYLPERDSVRCSLRTVRFAMSPKADYTVNNSVRFPLRGQYEIGVDCLYVYDFLRIFRVRVDIGETETVSVLPRRLNLDMGLVGATSDSARKTRKDPNSYEKIEISDIREYRGGDALKSIHWKLSSKSEEFMVKNYDTGTSRETYIFCDLSAHFPKQPPTDDELSLPAGLSAAEGDGLPPSERKNGADRQAATAAQAADEGNKVEKSDSAERGEVRDNADNAGKSRGEKRKKSGSAKRKKRDAEAAHDKANAAAVSEGDIERLAEDVYYEDMNEYCADGVVELTVAAVMQELRDGCECTLAWFDQRADGGLFCFTLHDMADFESIFRLFSMAPLGSADNYVSRLSGLMKDAQDVKQIYVTAALSPDDVRRLCAMPSVGTGASSAAEVIYFNPEGRYANPERRKLYIEGCREQLATKGLGLVVRNPVTGGEMDG